MLQVQVQEHVQVQVHLSMSSGDMSTLTCTWSCTGFMKLEITPTWGGR